jgi:hypothetical protein
MDFFILIFTNMLWFSFLVWREIMHNKERTDWLHRMQAKSIQEYEILSKIGNPRIALRPLETLKALAATPFKPKDKTMERIKEETLKTAQKNAEQRIQWQKKQAEEHRDRVA